MTTATRKALEKVRDLLHEAGWDQPRPAASAIAPVRDDLALLGRALDAGQSVEDAGRALGLTPEQTRARFAEALRRLCAFAEIAEAQGFAGPPA